MKGFLTALLFIPLMGWSAVGSITQQEHQPPAVTRADKTLEGVKGFGVEMSDKLLTAQGTAEITFVDDTVVQMTESAKLIIDEFVYDPNNSDAGKLALKVASGTARYASGQIAKNNPQKVKIKTPSATVSVRGTDFTATVDEIGATTVILLPSCPYGWLDLERDCVTGAIEVESQGGSVFMDKPFEATRVPNLEAKPTPPVKLPTPPEIRYWEVPILDKEIPVPSAEILSTAATTATVSVAATLTATAIFKQLVSVMKPVIKKILTKKKKNAKS